MHDSPKIVLNHLDDDKSSEEVKNSPPPVVPSVHRQLDLDDFANSPAADADDRGSSEDEGLDAEAGHDVEMRIALG